MRNILEYGSYSYPGGMLIYPFSRQLECFLAIVKSGTISGAAESLDMDQGNLSKTLKQLEGRLGYQLFHRHNKGLTPNEKGIHLFRILEKMSQSWKLGQQGPSPGQGDQYFEPLRLGCHSSVGRKYLPPLFSFLRKKNWQSPIETQLDRSSAITRRVMERKIDLGIVANPVKSRDLILRQIAVEHLELVAQNENISRENSLLFNPQMLFAEGTLRGLSFSKVIEIEDYDLIAEICAYNPDYVGILPSSVRERYPKLKLIKSLKNRISISLITFPQSKAVAVLTEVSSMLNKL